MNWDIIKGNWKQFRGKVKETWGNLTDDELDVIDGSDFEAVDVSSLMADPNSGGVAG